MKKNRIGLAMLLMMLAGNARGAEAPAAESSVIVDDKANQSAEIQKAFDVLAKANLLVQDPINQKVKIRSDIIEQMRANGLIKTEYADHSTFCM